MRDGRRRFWLERWTRLSLVALVAGGLCVPGALARVSAAGAGGVQATTLSVLSASPGDGVGEVVRTTPVRVFFDRPVVALSGVGTETKLDAVTLTPPAPGHARWLNTSTWEWVPSPALHGATRYAVTVSAGLRAVDGTALSTTYTSSFSTVRPAVASMTPANGASYADPHTSITIRFNQSVDKASASAALSVRGEGQGTTLVNGIYTWPRPDTLVFHPTDGLQPGQLYAVAVSTALRSAEGPLGATESAHWTFTTAGALNVSTTAPSDGAMNVDNNGNLSITFTAPVDVNSVKAHLHVSPPLAGQGFSLSDDGTVLSLYGSFTPSTAYSVDLPSANGTFGQPLLHPLHLHFTTAALPAALSFVASPYGAGPLGVDAYRFFPVGVYTTNDAATTLSLYAVSRQTVLSTLNSGATPAIPPVAPLIQLRQNIAARLDETTAFTRTVGFGTSKLLKPGYYLLVARGTARSDAGPAAGNDINTARVLLVVTRTALTLKTWTGATLLWATDLRTGQPVPHGRVRILRANGGGLVSGGSTDARGVFTAPNVYPTDNGVLVAEMDRAGDVALCSTNWNGSNGYNGGYSSVGVQSTLYTDRPIYRPGATVDVRGLARRDDDGAYALIARGTAVQVTLIDANNHIVATTSATLDRFGAFATRFTLPTTIALGQTTVQAQIRGESTTAGIQVADYRTPDFTVTAGLVHPDALYASGDTVPATTTARYLFDAGVARASVKWTAASSPYYFAPPAYGDYTFQDRPPLYEPYVSDRGAGPSLVARGPGAIGGEVPIGGGQPTIVAKGTGRTDDSGRFAFQVKANLRRQTLSQQWTIESTVTSSTNAAISAQTSVVIHRALFYIGLRDASNVVTAGVKTRLDLLTLGDDGATRQPNVSMTLRLYRRTYRFTMDPQGGEVEKTVDTLVTQSTGTTGANGRGEAILTLPKAGEYRLIATTRDGRGNPVRSALSLWVSDPAETSYAPWPEQPKDQITLVPDKTLYRVGDTARILVQAPRAGMTALVTTERGRVYSVRVVTLSSASPVLRIPITAQDIPNMFVSVVVVSGTAGGAPRPLWKEGVAGLVVDTSSKVLHVTLTASTARAHPGEKTTVYIHAADSNGLPVQGEFSLSVVDAGVLTLATNTTPALRDAFYSQRGLGVSTAYSQQIAVVQPSAQVRHAPADAVPSRAYRPVTGGGGGGGSGGTIPVTVRSHFPDTAYWNAAVTTDPNGNAAVVVGLPDNLTTWHIAARGLTVDTLVGEGALDVLSTKDVILRPFVPRFLTLGDRVGVGGSVVNTTAAAIDAHVTMDASGVLYSKDVVVPAGQEQLVSWMLAPAALGVLPVRLIVTTGAGGPTDGVALSIPVQVNSTPETVATAGQIGTTHVDVVTAPASAVGGEGGLTLTLQPSLVGGLRSSVDYLVHYPYEASDDLASRIMGEVSLLRLPAAATGLSPALLASYQKDERRSIIHLLALQRSSGGWAWWSDSPSTSAWLTALSLDALTTARRTGAIVPDDAIARGNAYLAKALAQPSDAFVDLSPELAPYAAFAVDEANALKLGPNSNGGQGAGAVGPNSADAGATIPAGSGSGPAGDLYQSREALPLWARAYLLRALSIEAGNKLDARGATLLSDLEAAAVTSATGTHWQGVGDGVAGDDDVHTTASVLGALVAVDPTNGLIAPATRWLMSVRKGAAWEGAIDNAVALRALSDAARSSHALDGRYSYAATIDGAGWGRGSVGPATLSRTQVLTAPVAPGRTTIIGVTRSNPSGVLYYALDLTYYRSVDRVGPLARGFALSRAYLYNGKPAKGALPTGTVVQVRLTLTSAQDLYYVDLEDPFPAGAEGVDPSLNTTSRLAATGRLPHGTTDLGWYLDHVELRDDRAALFLSYLPAGTYTYVYNLHLTNPGVFHVLPVHGFETGFPEVFARGGGGFLTVT